MMTIARGIALTLLLVAPAAGQPLSDTGGQTAIRQFSPLPLHQIAEQVTQRYAGRLLAADTRAPRSEEKALGVELVYQFRLITMQRNLLDLRIDARTGRFLSVSGRGQIEARQPLRQ